jgi:hypothetical protein
MSENAQSMRISNELACKNEDDDSDCDGDSSDIINASVQDQSSSSQPEDPIPDSSVNDDDDENRPAWMRYLASPPWNARSVHGLMTTVDKLEEVSTTAKRVGGRTKVSSIPRSSNPFAAHITLLRAKRRNDDEETPTHNDDDADSDTNEDRCKKRRRKLTPRVDEASMLFSFCKVDK